MTRGEGTQSKVHFKGKNDDFIIFVDDVEAYNKWKSDSSVSLAQFISSFKIFLTHKQGAQGTLDTAPKSTLAAEFDTEDENTCIEKILREGSLQFTEAAGRQGPKNDSKSTMSAK